MLLAKLMPFYHARRAEHRVVNGSMSAVYDAAIATDFLDAVRRHRAVRVLFALRSGAERIVSALRMRKYVAPPAPPTLRVCDIPDSGEWVRLGETPSREIAFGAIGRFWAGETEWLNVTLREFESFAYPGYARIACSLSVTPLGHGRVLLSYEVRTKATDRASRRAFRRYWRFVSPFVGVVMRATLSEIERRYAAANRPRSRRQLVPHTAGRTG